MVQGGNEAGLIPATMLLRGWCGGVEELGEGERSVRLVLREGAEDPRAAPGLVCRRQLRAPGLLVHPGGPWRVAVPRGRWCR